MKRRRGTLLVAVLVALLVVTAMHGLSLRSVALLGRQTAAFQRRDQAAWLTESGINRAVWQLNRDADYRGEVWRPELAPYGKAEVTISITHDDATTFTVSVTTRWPIESPSPNVHRHHILVIDPRIP